MRRTLIVDGFEITVTPALAWWQSYWVSRNEPSGIWSLYERRDHGDDERGKRVVTTITRFRALVELGAAVVSGVAEAGDIDNVAESIRLAGFPDSQLPGLRDQLTTELASRDLLDC